MSRQSDYEAVVAAAMGALADVILAQVDGAVVKRVIGESTRYLVPAAPQGLPVMVAHEHSVHLWLEAGDGWVVHCHAEEVEELFDEWKGLLLLAVRIASGTEAPSNPTADGVWEVSDGNTLFRRIGSEGRRGWARWRRS